jgi:hypothetical protein
MALGRRDVAIGAALALGTLALYAATACPTIYVEDSAEFATAAAVLGVPHPPGYPLYTMLAALFVRAVPFADVAARANLFSAACGAATVAVLWALLRRLGTSRVAALTAALCFALGAAFWSECLAAEVHTLNALLLALALLFFFEAARRPAARAFVAAGLFAGLAVGHRNLNLLFLAPLIVPLERARRDAKGDRRLLAYAVAAAAATAVVYLYLPLAARRHPALAMGAPTTWSRFVAVVTAAPYVRHLAAGSFETDLGRALAFVTDLPRNLGIALVAAPFGLAAWRRQKDDGEGPPGPFAVAWIAGACVLFSSCYDVPDVASYFIPAYLALAIAAGVGLDSWSGRARPLLPLLALCALPFVLPSVSLRHTTLARDYARALLAGAPRDAVVVSFSDTETHVLAYAQAVEGRRGDVVAVSASELDDWYVEELRRRHPQVSWPAASDATTWLRSLALQNEARRICLTQPLDLGLPDERPDPAGLLTCLTPRARAADLDQALAFWKTTAMPAPAALERADVHVHMLAFSFAMSRFSLAAALADAGRFDEARAELSAVVAARPDESEALIAASMKALGRERRRDLELGRRAAAALSIDARDPRFVAVLRL